MSLLREQEPEIVRCFGEIRIQFKGSSQGRLGFLEPTRRKVRKAKVIVRLMEFRLDRDCPLQGFALLRGIAESALCEGQIVVRLGAVAVQKKRFLVQVNRSRRIAFGQFLIGAIGDDRRLVLALDARLALPKFCELPLRGFGVSQATQYVAQLEADIGIVWVQALCRF